MRTIAVDPLAPDSAGISAGVEILASGGVIAFPTETFYGLGADPWNERALASLFIVKGRPESMPILLLLADDAQADAVADRTPPAFAVLARAFWPGPLTLVVEARASLPPAVTAGTGTVGVRVPSSEIPRSLARTFGRPITGTSANRTGNPAARTAHQVASSLLGGSDLPPDPRPVRPDAPGSSRSDGTEREALHRLDLILDGGESPGGEPSTVVDLTGARPKLVRPGAVPFDAVLAAL